MMLRSVLAGHPVFLSPTSPSTRYLVGIYGVAHRESNRSSRDWKIYSAACV